MTIKTPIYGLLAEFDNAESIVAAARRTHANGYQRAEAYTPFLVEDLDEALGYSSTSIPLIFLIAGILGAISGFFMCWYANVVSYPLNIGGRPHNSWPAWIPLTFELTILFAGVSGAVGMLFLNGFPCLHHPIFNEPNFKRASNDHFFLCIESRDPQFELQATTEFLKSLHPLDVFEVPMS